MKPLSQFAEIAPLEKGRRPKPVPIDFVITDLDPGGAERQLSMLVAGLDRSLWDPRVIALQGEGALVATLRASGIDVLCLRGDKRKPFRLLWRLHRALKRRRPAIVQSYLFHANVLSRMAAIGAGVRCHIGGIRVAEPRSWHLRLERWTQCLGNGSICVSAAVRRHMIERGRIDPRRLAVIPNGVDMSRFENAIPVSRESIGVADAALMILYVGRLDPQKNVDALIDLACEMSLGPREIAFVMVGDGPDSSRLRTRAEELPAGRPAFHWLGRREDVAALLATADIAVLPSHWEGMPNFALEAMAAGKPMIVNAFEGADEVIRDGETGWICRLSTPTGVARFRDLVAMAATSPHELAMVGAAARLDVARRFAPAATIAQYQELWNRVLAACAKRPVEPV